MALRAKTTANERSLTCDIDENIQTCVVSFVWGGSKEVVNFPWILGNAEFSPWTRLPEFIELPES